MKRKPSEKFSWKNVPSTDVLDSIFSEMEAHDRGQVLADAKKPHVAQQPKPPPQLPPPKKAKEKIDYAKYLPADWKEQKKAAEEKKKLQDAKAEVVEIDASELVKSVPASGSESSKWELISDAPACQKAVGALRNEKLLGIDCEGVSLSRSGKICLIQIATRTERVYLFDILTHGAAMMKEGGLRELLENPVSLKILHDCRNDSDALFHQYGVVLKNVYDTQIAYAVVCQDMNRGTPLPVGLNTLLRLYAMGRDNPYKETARAEMEKNASYWEERPLSETAIQYARFDVMLLPLVHKQLDALMTSQSRNIVKQYSAQYVDQYRVMATRPLEQYRREPKDTKDTKDASADRFIPVYGIEQWDTDARSRLGLDRKSRIKALSS